MIKNLIIGLVLSTSIVSAQSLSTILELIENNNSTIKQQKYNIDVSKITEALSNSWQNPVIGFGFNDINLDNPNSRDLEPMQTQYISYSQVIPTNGKLQTKTNISRYNSVIDEIKLENLKIKLKSQAISLVYNYILQKEKLTLLYKYLDNLKKQKELITLLYENGKIDQSKLVSLDLREYKLELKKQKIEYKIAKIHALLENLTYEKIDTITVKENRYNDSVNIDSILDSHPLVQIVKNKIKQQEQKTKLAKDEKISDVKFTVGYYNRENFDDYISMNLSLPLGLQGREKLQIQQSYTKTKALNNQLLALQQQLKTTIDELLIKISTSKKNYLMIEEKMIPLNDSLKQSHTIHLSTNMMNSISVYESINNRYDLLLLSKDEKLSYLEALSKLQYFKGNL